MLTLSARTAQDLMTPGSFSLSATATVAEASTYLTTHQGGAAVVIDSAGHPLGVITKTDLVNYQRDKSDRPHGAGHPPTTVRDIMTPATFTVKSSASSVEAIRQMIELDVHHLFVTNDTGVVIGAIEPMNVVKLLT